MLNIYIFIILLVLYTINISCLHIKEYRKVKIWNSINISFFFNYIYKVYFQKIFIKILTWKNYFFLRLFKIISYTSVIGYIFLNKFIYDCKFWSFIRSSNIWCLTMAWVIIFTYNFKSLWLINRFHFSFLYILFVFFLFHFFSLFFFHFFFFFLFL